MSVVNKQVGVAEEAKMVWSSSPREHLERNVYSTLSEAIEELERRKNSTELTEKISKFLGTRDVPNILTKSKKIPAVFFRQLGSPNYEMRRFVALAELGNFAPLIWEYLDDKFVTANPEKYSLGKMSFFHGTGKKGGAKINRTKVVDLQQYNGKKISEVRTLWDESLVDFHHRLLLQAYATDKVDLTLFDASQWFGTNGHHAANYYDLFLSLFIRDALLFENFLTDGPEREFTEKVFFPAFERIHNALGVKPLIVALDPTEVEGDEFWRCYPPELEGAISAQMIQSTHA